MDYYELTLKLTPRNPWTEIAIAELAELGFDGFVENNEGVQAYAPVTVGSVMKLLGTTSFVQAEGLSIEHEITVIPHQNWNEQWESDFEPVIVDNRLAIIAPFHDVANYNEMLQVVIQPQMSFGTGHHQTTYLMSQYVLDMQPIPTSILDMGTGTGVLAILAEKLGCTSLVAVDIEPWSVENTIANAERNGCKAIEVIEGDIDVVPTTIVDCILANINKNVLKAHLPEYSQRLNSGGTLILSGFFVTDVEELILAAKAVGFEWVETRDKETWAAISFKKVSI